LLAWVFSDFRLYLLTKNDIKNQKERNNPKERRYSNAVSGQNLAKMKGHPISIVLCVDERLAVNEFHAVGPEWNYWNEEEYYPFRCDVTPVPTPLSVTVIGCTKSVD
jgi:hypothetical protein